MKLREYFEELSELVKDNPKLLDLEVVHSSDDEGNSYFPVTYSPLPGVFGGYGEGFEVNSDNPNAVCVN